MPAALAMNMDKAAHRKAAALRRADAHAQMAEQATTTICATISSLIRDRFGPNGPHKVLAGYMPIRTEISPLPAMRAHPGPVCVPVVVALHQPLAFHRWLPDRPMVTGRFGAQVPAQDDPLVPDILLVPLLAYDLRGYRLGYGGGFYDRTLARLRARSPVLAIGLAYGAQQADAVPTDATDERLDAVVTETGTVAFVS